jgi:hypothetical protein
MKTPLNVGPGISINRKNALTLTHSSRTASSAYNATTEESRLQEESSPRRNLPADDC